MLFRDIEGERVLEPEGGEDKGIEAVGGVRGGVAVCGEGEVEEQEVEVEGVENKLRKEADDELEDDANGEEKDAGEEERDEARLLALSDGEEDRFVAGFKGSSGDVEMCAGWLEATIERLRVG